MSQEHRNTYSRKVYSHKRQERGSSPVPLFDQVFRMRKPVLTDFEQPLDLSVKKVEAKTTENPKTSANNNQTTTKKEPVLFSPLSSDEDDAVDLLSEGTSLSDANAEDISDKELSLIRAHMSNIDSEGTGYSSQSLTVTFVLTSATGSCSSAVDSSQPVETPRQAAEASGIQVYGLADLSVDAVKEDEKSCESPQERFDQSGCSLDVERIRSSTPVNNSQLELCLFDSLSTISDKYERKASPNNAAKKGIAVPSPEPRLEELENNRENDKEDELEKVEIMIDHEEELEMDEEEEEEEEESFSYATLNEMTPPHSNQQSACPLISLKHSLRYRKKDKSKKLRSSRCIFPEESIQEQINVAQSSLLTQQAKEMRDCPLGFRHLTSTPLSFWDNQDYNCLPPPATSTITIAEVDNSTTCPTSRELTEKDRRLEMLASENLEKQAMVISGHAAGHKHLTSTPVSFLKNKIESYLPPTFSAITILEPRCCVDSTELESNGRVAEPEGLLASGNQKTLREARESLLPLPELSSEDRIRWKSGCGRQTKRCRISTDETDKPETINDDFPRLPMLKPPYMVGPDLWNIPYKTTEGQTCEHRDVELCSIVRLPFVEENPVPLFQCEVQKNAMTSYSPDFLESF